VTERRAAPDLRKLGWRRPHGRGSPTSGGMPPCKRRSLGDPRVCSRIISIAEVDRRHAAREPRRIAGKRADLARTACASTHVGSCARAAKRWVAVAVLEPAPGLSRSRCEGLIDGRCLGLFNRAELALRERKGPSVLQVGSPSWRVRRECDRGRQRHARPARATPNKLARVTGRAKRGSARLTRGRTLSQLVTRRPIAPPPGAGVSGNGAPASVPSSSFPPRAGARVNGATGEAPIRTAQVRGSGIGRFMGARDN
jgi:hypothetical protein